MSPLLLIPIGTGAVLSNIPFAEIAAHTIQTVGADGHVSVDVYGGFIGQFYDMGVASGLFSPTYFLGCRRYDGFWSPLGEPKDSSLGRCRSVRHILRPFLEPILLEMIPGFSFLSNSSGATLAESILHVAGSIGIIGGADGPTAIFTTARLAPNYLGPIAVAAYSYMALVPIIQPPIMEGSHHQGRAADQDWNSSGMSPNSKELPFPVIVLIICILRPSQRHAAGWYADVRQPAERVHGHRQAFGYRPERPDEHRYHHVGAIGRVQDVSRCLPQFFQL